MHCIGELIDAMARWSGLEMRRQHRVAGRADRGHHPVRADGDHAVAGGERHRLLAERARRVGDHRLHDVADERAVLRPRGGKSRRLVAAPDDRVGSGFDLGDLVPVDPLLVPGEIQHLRSGLPERLADGEQHRVAEAAAGEHHGLFRLRSPSACPSAPSARRARRASAARTDRTSRPSRARSSRQGPAPCRPTRR